jgi:hypothetical protein
VTRQVSGKFLGKPGGGILLVGIFLALIIMALWGPCQGQAAPVGDRVAKESAEAALVTAAAQRDFPKFLSAALKDDQGKGYGFKPGDGPSTVSLGPPIRVYGLDSSMGDKVLKSSKIADLVVPVGEWIFPVVAGPEYRTLFGVRLMGGEWKGAYLGNPVLARKLQDLRRAWHNKEGDSFRLVSCPDPRGFLFTVTTEKEENLTPLIKLPLGKGQVLAPPDDLRNLKKAKETLAGLAAYWKAAAQTQGQ